MRRLLRGAMVVFGWFVVPYSRIAICRTSKKKLPPITNPLLEIPAVKLASMIRNKEVSHFSLQYCGPIKQKFRFERFIKPVGDERIDNSGVHWPMQRSQSHTECHRWRTIRGGAERGTYHRPGYREWHPNERSNGKPDAASRSADYDKGEHRRHGTAQSRRPSVQTETSRWRGCTVRATGEKERRNRFASE